MDTTIRDDRYITRNGYCALSWSAIIAGALVAFSLSTLLNLLNAGLGLIAFPQTFRGLAGVTIAGYIWLAICAIVALFIAGWVAGKIVGHDNKACYGLLHGFLAWSLSLLITLIVAAHFASAGIQALGTAAASPENRFDATRLIEQRDMGRTEQAGDVAGTATLGIFFIFLLGAAAAAAGGYVGSKGTHGHTHTPTSPTTKL